jgi:hypothetical protein
MQTLSFAEIYVNFSFRHFLLFNFIAKQKLNFYKNASFKGKSLWQNDECLLNLFDIIIVTLEIILMRNLSCLSSL